jgi:hypothetical protein
MTIFEKLIDSVTGIISPTQPHTNNNNSQLAKDIKLIFITMVVLLNIGIIGLLMFTLGTSDADRAQLTGNGLLIAGASLLVGTLMGFLFGIPRFLQQNSLSDGTNNNNGDQPNHPSNYKPNTNLEQISDWLTKIMVGLGLAHIYALPSIFERIARHLTPGFSGSLKAYNIILTIIIYFLVCGFIFSYILTRLFLTGAFSRADRSAQEQINRLVELELDPSLLDQEEKILLLELHDRQQPYVLDEEFKRDSSKHTILRSLRNKQFIRPKEGGSWQTGKTVELTPIGKVLIDRNLSSLRR